MNKKSSFALDLFLVLLTALEVLNSFWLLKAPPAMKLVAVLCHCLLAVLFSITLRQVQVAGESLDKNLAFIALILGLALPFYGISGMLIMYFCIRMLKMKPGAYFEFDRSLLRKKRRLAPRDMEENIITLKSDELEVESFRDIFRSNDPRLEENAISTLAKITTRDAIKLLREVVQTSQNDSKILAATALTEMEDRIIRKIEQVKNRLKKRPDDQNALLELARTYDSYCYLGLLDPVLHKHYRNLALDQYRHFLELQPNHPQANLEYGRLLLSAGRISEAASALLHTMTFLPDDPRPRMWLAEAYYEMSDYQAVGEVCDELATMKNMPSRFKEIVDWWRLTDTSQVETNQAAPL